VIHNVIHTVAPYLAPLLFQCLHHQSEDLEDDDWNVAKSASTCLTLMAQTIRDEIVPITTPFIGEFITSTNWRQKEAATMTLGCIIDGPTTASPLMNSLSQVLPLLLKHLQEDPSLIVRDTTAWTIGKISQFFPDVIEANLGPVVETLMNCMAQQQPMIAVQACDALIYVLSIFRYEEEDTSPLSPGFVTLFQALLNFSDRSGASENNLCVTAYEAIVILISHAAKDCDDAIISLINPFIEKIRSTFSTSVDSEIQVQLQSFIPSVLQTITSRIEGLIAPFARSIIQVCFQIFEFRKCVIDEPMTTICAVLSECDDLITAVFPPMKPFLLSATSHPEDVNSFIASLHCITVLSDDKNIDLFVHDQGAFCNNLMQNLFSVLQNPNASFEIKPEVFSAFADVALCIGRDFERYFPTVMQAMEPASQMEIPKNCDDDLIDNIIRLRETLCQTYSLLVRSECGALLIPYLAVLQRFFTLVWNDRDYREKGLVKKIVFTICDIYDVFGQRNINEFMNCAIVKEIIRFGKNQSTSSKVRQKAARLPSSR